MRASWFSAVWWTALGFVAGLVAGVAGNAVTGDDLFGRITWLLALATAAGFGSAECWRIARRRRA